MNDKPKEKVYAERFDASKKEREELSKKEMCIRDRLLIDQTNQFE